MYCVIRHSLVDRSRARLAAAFHLDGQDGGEASPHCGGAETSRAGVARASAANFEIEMKMLEDACKDDPAA